MPQQSGRASLLRGAAGRWRADVQRNPSNIAGAHHVSSCAGFQTSRSAAKVRGAPIGRHRYIRRSINFETIRRSTSCGVSPPRRQWPASPAGFLPWISIRRLGGTMLLRTPPVFFNRLASSQRISLQMIQHGFPRLALLDQ